MTFSTCLLAALVVAAPQSAKKPPADAGVSAPSPAGGERTLVVTDATNAAPVSLAPAGQTTTLAFPIDVVEQKVVLVDVGKRVQPVVQGSSIILVNLGTFQPGASVPLTVALVDGTQLNFSLFASPQGFDRFVRVELQLATRASEGSAQKLKAALAETQAKLDECTSASADTALTKLGALMVKQDLSKPDAFTVEKRSMKSGIDKQNRLLVETQYVFRLFDVAYLVFTVENRDPTQPWVLERAELAAGGADVRVLGTEQELNSIPPGETSKVVIAFRMPSLADAQRFTLRLFEKNGARHFSLPDLKL